MTVSVKYRSASAPILGLVALAMLGGVAAWGKELKLAQMRGYSASGTHQCGS